jgi:hypothetical protein
MGKRGGEGKRERRRADPSFLALVIVVSLRLCSQCRLHRVSPVCSSIVCVDSMNSLKLTRRHQTHLLFSLAFRALDMGTTSTRFIIFDEWANNIASYQVEFDQHYPHPG